MLEDRTVPDLDQMADVLSVVVAAHAGAALAAERVVTAASGVFGEQARSR